MTPHRTEPLLSDHVRDHVLSKAAAPVPGAPLVRSGPVEVWATAQPGVPGTTLSTVGVSDTELASTIRRRTVRVEFLAIAGDEVWQPALTAALTQVAEDCLASGVVVNRGSAVRCRPEVAAALGAGHLYVSRAVYHDRSFGQLRAAGHRAELWWLFPLRPEEERFLAANSWERFEDLLVEARPALADPARPAISLPAPRRGRTV
ncbi:suppressor of fused domain protein [Streptomyces sp. NBC_01336]|uniref:suppressor of fused domain protein n=1 Tax=unclassified Streptomyces TaxID=2593676 RepID=UPI002E118A89|nr:suppressor of fused domain protein [Streptomyces sp. NBC_01336]